MTEQLQAKIEDSKKTLRLASEMSQHYYEKPIIICYSGGKDSDCILRLAMECLNPDEFEVLHSITTVDSCITNKYVNDIFMECEDKGIKAEKHIPRDKNGNPTNMWKLIIDKGIPPTRLQRYCCQTLKETSTNNRLAVLGVRGGESVGRKGRDTFGVRGGSYAKATFFSFEHTAEVHREALEKEKEENGTVWDCTLIKVMRDRNDTVVNPIYEWSDTDVWDYLNERKYPHNPMYDKGYHRVGCIGCPMATYKQKMKEFADFPYARDMYINTFDKMLEKRKAEGKDDSSGKWQDGLSVYKWWIEEGKYVTEGQMTLNDYETDEWGLIVRPKEKQ